MVGQMVCPMVRKSRNEVRREAMKMREVKVKQVAACVDRFSFI